VTTPKGMGPSRPSQSAPPNPSIGVSGATMPSVRCPYCGALGWPTYPKDAALDMMTHHPGCIRPLVVAANEAEAARAAEEGKGGGQETE
jgi:hypothetical protein